jgi:hypothetical protein
MNEVFSDTGHTDFFDVIAFDYYQDPGSWVLLAPQVLLATATRSDNPHKPPSTISSPSTFGPLPHHIFNMSFPNAPDTPMEAWGLVCQTGYQFGTLHMSRNSSTGQWMYSNLFFPDPSISYPVSWIALFEPPPYYHAPASRIGGLGAALANSAYYGEASCPENWCPNGWNVGPPANPVNFTLFAYNFLYATASLEFYLHNVARLPEASELTVNVTVSFEDLVYGIVVVRGLLICALWAAVAACAVGLLAAGRWAWVQGLGLGLHLGGVGNGTGRDGRGEERDGGEEEAQYLLGSTHEEEPADSI